MDDKAGIIKEQLIGRIFNTYTSSALLKHSCQAQVFVNKEPLMILGLSPDGCGLCSSQASSTCAV